MRMIDADVLLADIHNAMCADCNDECAACQWRDAIRLIEEAPTIVKDTNVLSKWVSVKDRMPPNDDTKVLAYGDPVTHWMPLPTPPEEVSGDG